MKLVLAAGLVALGASAAIAEPINKYTITGRSSAAAVAQDVPLDQTPKPEAPQAATDGSVATGAAPGSPETAAAPPKPRVQRYGLIGLSWRSQ